MHEGEDMNFSLMFLLMYSMLYFFSLILLIQFDNAKRISLSIYVLDNWNFNHQQSTYEGIQVKDLNEITEIQRNSA